MKVRDSRQFLQMDQQQGHIFTVKNQRPHVNKWARLLWNTLFTKAGSGWIWPAHCTLPTSAPQWCFSCVLIVQNLWFWFGNHVKQWGGLFSTMCSSWGELWVCNEAGTFFSICLHICLYVCRLRNSGLKGENAHSSQRKEFNELALTHGF